MSLKTHALVLVPFAMSYAYLSLDVAFQYKGRVLQVSSKQPVVHQVSPCSS